MTASPQVSISVVLALANVIDQYQTLLALDETNKPCHFYDSVNISDATPLPNGSYIHDSITYPPHLVGVFNYTYPTLNERQSTAEHLRGCICYIKNCTRLCCSRGHTMDADERECDDLNINDEFYTTNVTLSSGYNRVVKIYDRFGVTHGIPCFKGDGYFLEPHEMETDAWQMHPSGEVELLSLHRFFSKDKYCLAPRVLDENMTTWILSPYLCFADVADSEKKNVHYIKGLTICLSIPFMVITIIVYTVVSELRNLHGKCLRCHLLSMVISGCLLAYMKYNYDIQDEVFCNILAYGAYFFILAGFFWLNVISFDLWWNFRGTTGIRKYDTKRFIFYSLYSWGMPLGFSILATILQHIGSLPEHFKIGFGEGNYCFIEVTRWIQMFYLFGPILLVILGNAIMFIMTAVKIHKVQKEMGRIMSNEDSRKNLEKEKARIGLFLRLFIIMGVTWSMETVSWMSGGRMKWFFYVTDTCNALMGVIIFFLFVVKKKIKNLIVKSNGFFKKIFDNGSGLQSSPSTSTTTTTPISCKRQLLADETPTRILKVLDNLENFKPVLKATDMEIGKEYAVVAAKRLGTKYGEKVVLGLEDYQLFLPHRYDKLECDVIEALNTESHNVDGINSNLNKLCIADKIDKKEADNSSAIEMEGDPELIKLVYDKNSSRKFIDWDDVYGEIIKDWGPVLLEYEDENGNIIREWGCEPPKKKK